MSDKPKKEKRYNKRGLVVRKAKTAERAATKYKRHKLRFVSTGTQEGWKHITNVKLTKDRNIKLPRALNALVPKEIQSVSGAVPLLSIMMSKKLGIALIFCRGFETTDTVTKIDGKMQFVRDLPKPIEYGD